MRKICMLLMFAVVLLSTAAYGQGTASILGTVTDPSGAWLFVPLPTLDRVVILE